MPRARRRRRVSERVQFLAEPGAKDRYRRVAQADGDTLSEWLRRVADTAAGGDPERGQLGTRKGLEEFFRQLNAYEDAVTGRPRPRT